MCMKQYEDQSEEEAQLFLTAEGWVLRADTGYRIPDTVDTTKTPDTGYRIPGYDTMKKADTGYRIPDTDT